MRHARTTTRRTTMVSALVVLGLLGACSGDDDEDVRENTAPPATDAPTTDAGTAPAPTPETEPDTTPPATAAPDTEPVDTEPVDTEPVDTSPAPGGEKWTVLVYSIADTDLEPFLLADVGEMGTVGSSDTLDIVALVDRSADYTDEDLLGLGDFVGAKLLHVGQGTAEVLEDYGDLNTGDPEVLAEFVARGITENPADHYALVLSDHGASWPGVGADESFDHDALTVAEITDGIAAGLEAAGLERLDLLGFDACLMATYEVASAMAPLAERLLASQELEPGHGWDYTVLQALADDPSTDVDTLGSLLIDGFEGQAQAEGTDSEITLSLIDLTQMAALDEAVASFSDALVERAAELAPLIGQKRATTLSFGRSPDPAEDTHMADLGILVSEIGVEALDVSDQADTLIRALGDAVVDTVAGSAMEGATGLSIYFPPYPDYYNPGYEEVATAGEWAEFLSGYYSAGEAIPEAEQPDFTNEDGIGEVFFDEDGLNIVGTFDIAAQDNLAEATISYGLVGEDGSVTFIGEEPAQISDDGSGVALGIYDLTALTITDGIDTAYAYLALTLDVEAGVATIDVPLAYYAPGDVEGETYQDVLLSLTIDIETTDILNETYYAYDDELASYGELFAEPEGLIVPEVLYVSADGEEAEWVPTSDVGLFANLPDLLYDLEPLPTGTQLYVELTVTDFGGNTDSVSAVVEVP